MNNWIIFDAMGVIFEVGDDTNELLVPFIRHRKPQVDEKHIQAIYLQASLGQITASDFWRLVGLEEAYPQIEQTYLDTCLKLDPQFKETATELSRENSLAILSNDVKEWSFYLRGRYGLSQLCREVIISSEVGYRKPSPEIYEILLERLAVPAKQCIFIDDRIANLRPAIEIGITPVWYQRKAETKNQEIQYSIQNFTELPEIVAKIFAI
jgi:putative hydrolase of the HAD superfamily